jgi:type IV pilus assembly protein PilX
MNNHTSIPGSRQQGISLVIVLIFLTVLSLLGITMIQSSTLGARIAQNESDRNVAFQAAEAALRDAENDVRFKLANGSECTVGGTTCRADKMVGTDFSVTCTGGLCDSRTATTPVWETSSNWSDAGPNVKYGTYTQAGTYPMVATQPRYLIEYFPIGDTQVVRITAVGYGLNSTTRTMLQTSLKVRMT